MAREMEMEMEMEIMAMRRRDGKKGVEHWVMVNGLMKGK